MTQFDTANREEFFFSWVVEGAPRGTFLWDRIDDGGDTYQNLVAIDPSYIDSSVVNGTYILLGGTHLTDVFAWGDVFALGDVVGVTFLKQSPKLAIVDGSLRDPELDPYPPSLFAFALSMDHGCTLQDVSFPAQFEHGPTNEFYSFAGTNFARATEHLSHSVALLMADSSGAIFTVSLENLHSDPVVSVHEGVILANTRKKNSPTHIESVISFNNGFDWNPITAPAKYRGGASIECRDPIQGVCRLHLRTATVVADSAPGIVIATGNAGSHLSNETSAWMSRDAGRSWSHIGNGSFTFGIGGGGAAIVAVPVDGLTNSLLFTLDEGGTWLSHRFSSDAQKTINVTRVVPVQSSKSYPSFLIFGTSELPSYTGEVFRVEFAGIPLPLCEDADYEVWSAAECIRGRTLSLVRRRSSRMCRDSPGYVPRSFFTDCECTRHDFECDTGYARSDVRAPCVASDMPAIRAAAERPVCRALPGEIFHRGVSLGYKRASGNTCAGGVDLEPRPRACTRSLLFVLALGAAIFLVLSATGFVIIRKFRTRAEGAAPGIWIPLLAFAISVMMAFSLVANRGKAGSVPGPASPWCLVVRQKEGVDGSSVFMWADVTGAGLSLILAAALFQVYRRSSKEVVLPSDVVEMLSDEGVMRVTAWLQEAPEWTDRFLAAARSPGGALSMDNAAADAIIDHFTSGIFRINVLAHVRTNCLPAIEPCMLDLARSLKTPVAAKSLPSARPEDAEGAFELLQALYGSVVQPEALGTSPAHLAALFALRSALHQT